MSKIVNNNWLNPMLPSFVHILGKYTCIDKMQQREQLIGHWLQTIATSR